MMSTKSIRSKISNVVISILIYSLTGVNNIVTLLFGSKITFVWISAFSLILVAILDALYTLRFFGLVSMYTNKFSF